MKVLRFALPAAFLAAAASALPAPPVQPPAAADKSFGEQVEVNVVNVEVYVTDANGKRVDGLQRGDFTLLEDGKPMQILNFDAVDRTAAAAQAVAPVPVPAAPGSEPAVAPAAPAAEAVSVTDPLHMVIYIDNTHLAPSHRTRVLEQLRGFLTRRLNPGDAVMLATYDPGLHVRLPFTADRNALSRALDAVEKAAGDGGGDSRARRAALEQVQGIQERALIAHKKETQKGEKRDLGPAENDMQADTSDTLCPPEIADPVKSYAQTARQEVLRSVTGLTVLVNSLSGLPGRKAVLHVSDGLSVTPGEELFQALYEMCGGGAATSGPSGSAVPSTDAAIFGATRTYRANQAMLDAQAYSTAKQWNDLAAHASAQRVTLYTLQASGLAGGASESADAGPGDRLLQTGSVAQIERENLRGSLTALASGTGGRAVFDANDLQRDIAHIEDDLGHYYSLGYTPPHTGDGHDHNIVVKVQGAGLHARYRQVYRDKPALERIVDRTLAALFLGTGDNPLAVTMEVGDITAGAAGSSGAQGSVVPIRLLIPLSNVGLTMRGEGYDGKLRLFVATSTTGGGNSAVRQIEVPLRIPMQNSQATMMQSYLYEVKLQLPPGEHRVAIGIRDDVTNMTSFLSKGVQVGGGPAK
ncbi:MAG TPA: VWA domain-containing protein [Thermoanaerobaculia bacterium]|jgi:VWFA-related protein|nr:VWA domain-containing protein [Thermoanaerobaculia bacterium]